MRSIGKRFIRNVSIEDDFYKINFLEIKFPLFWPCGYGVTGYLQVTSETFDPNDWHNYQTVFRIHDGEVLLDIGAAEGLFSLSVVDKCERIIMVEPNSHFVNALNRTFVDHQNKIEIIEVAVGELNGTASFSETSLHGSVLGENNPFGQTKIRKVDDLMANEPKLTFIKADIEGFELSMLRGAENTIKIHKPKIVITTYHRENDANEIIALIQSFVPEYNYKKQGIFHEKGKPVTVHFWIN